jgi:hypothetical protein
MILNLGIGLLTPPVGPTLAVGCAIGKVIMEAASRSFYIPMLVVLLLVRCLAELSPWLPRVLLDRGRRAAPGEAADAPAREIHGIRRTRDPGGGPTRLAGQRRGPSWPSADGRQSPGRERAGHATITRRRHPPTKWDGVHDGRLGEERGS